MPSRPAVRRPFPLVALAVSAACLAFSTGANAAVFPEVTSAALFSCAIKSDGRVACFGANGAPDGPPADLGTVKRVSSGSGTACAIRTDNIAVCWGDNDYGQGDIPADLGPVRQIETGNGHTCAIRLADSTVRCWGNNGAGQATPPGDLGAVNQVALGGYHSCALRLSGKVACWGGVDGPGFGAIAVPADLGTVKQITAGFYGFNCAIRTDGEAACWGDSGSTAGVVPGGVGAVKQISSGVASTCAVKSDSTLTCWGLSDRATVPADFGPVRQVSVGWNHTCAVRLNGTLGCWGTAQAVSQGATSPTAGAFPSLAEGVVDFGDTGGLDFGDWLAGGRSSVLKTYFTNSPLAPGATLKVKSASVSESASNAFSILSQSCDGSSLADGATCSMRVRFAPRIWQRGDLTGTITVTDDSTAGTHSIPLAGTAFEPPRFILQNPRAGSGYPGDTLPISWETSDAAKVSITVAHPVTSTVRVKVGKRIVTKTVTEIKQVPIATNVTAPAGPGTFNWLSKIGGKVTKKGTWDMVITAVSARGKATVNTKVTLWDPDD